MFSLFNLTLFLMCVIRCGGQILQFGACRELETVEFFDLQRFLGTWYEIRRYPTWYEDGGHCASKTFTVCGRRIGIEQKFVKNDIEYIINMNSTYAPGDDAIFQVNASNVDPIGMPLSVLATDYTNYAILFGCKSNEELKIRYISSWILSRKPILDPDLLDEALNSLRRLPMSNNIYFEVVSHEAEKCQHEWSAHIHVETIEL